METIPMPEPNGSIEHLREVFNLENEEDFNVIISALCYMLRGRPGNQGAYPIIVATGIEGSAKTTFVKVVKKLVDPGIPETRTPSSDIRDLFIAAHNGHILSLDNISFISRDMSDALCSLATGGGYARRKNYTDDEEQIFDICRPILLNGITFDRAPDLLSRSIICELRTIPPEERKTESEIWSRVNSYHRLIFGGLLTILSKAIREEKNIQDTRFDLPRLADFGRFSIALERGNGWDVGQIISSLQASYETALGDKAEGHPFIPIVVRIVKEIGYWCGSASELLKLVNVASSDTDRRLSLWPKTTEILGKHLKRDHSVYANQGVIINQFRNKQGRRWELSLKKKPEACEKVPCFEDIPPLSMP
jgi:hypothetical protein